MSDGVKVAQRSLEPLVQVRILVGQPKKLKFPALIRGGRWHSTVATGGERDFRRQPHSKPCAHQNQQAGQGTRRPHRCQSSTPISRMELQKPKFLCPLCLFAAHRSVLQTTILSASCIRSRNNHRSLCSVLFSLLLTWGENGPEPDDAVPAIRPVVATVRDPADPGADVPTAAPRHPGRAPSRTMRVRRRRGAIIQGRIPVPALLTHVPCHLAQTVPSRSEHRPARFGRPWSWPRPCSTPAQALPSPSGRCTISHSHCRLQRPCLCVLGVSVVQSGVVTVIEGDSPRPQP